MSLLGAERHPLDVLIQQLSENIQFLTSEQVDTLQKILPERIERSETGTTSLKKQIEFSIKMINQLNKLVVDSNDVGQVRQVLSSNKDLINLLIKFRETMDQEDRQIHIENAVVETLDELDVPDLKAKYLARLKHNLAKKK